MINFDLITIIILAFWALALLKNLLFAISLWQIKEYRLDRVRSWLFSYEGRSRVLSVLNITKWLVIIVYLAVPVIIIKNSLSPALLLSAVSVAIALIFLGEGVITLKRIISRSLSRPKPTARATFTFAIALATLAIIFVNRNPSNDLIFQLLIIDRAAPLLVSLLIIIGNPLMWLRNHRQAQKALKKRRGLIELKTIGITGSYGKSSVKEFTAALLEKHFRVVKTPANINTEIGIAQVILRQLTLKTEVFIVEMGAYKIGEIAKEAEIAQPTLGILTGLTDQHLTLFGSRSNILKAKFELMANLPRGSAALFNYDSLYVEPLLNKAKNMGLKVLTYGTHDKADYRVSDIQSTDKLTFVLHWQQNKAPITLNLLGKHQAVNFAASAGAALQLGMSFAEIIETSRYIRPKPQTLELKQLKSGARLIDDSYNANPAGVMAGLETLASFPAQRKLVLLNLMIELGPISRQAHQKASKKALSFCDQALTTSKNAFPELSFLKPRDFQKTLLKLSDKDVLLISGRLPRPYREILDLNVSSFRS